MRLPGTRATTLAAIGATALLAGTSLSAAAATNDTLRSKQWGLDQVHAEQAWPTSTGSGSVIAIVDTGVDLEHPDLKANLVSGATFTGCGKGPRPCGNGDFRGPDGENNDDEHGTHVAGIAAAVTNNGVGVAGVAPNADIMPVKVLEDGSGSYGDIADGVRWAADHGADVINLSLGALPGGQAFPITGLETDLADALAYARAKGVLSVAAAGNSATPLCSDPAFTDDVICVAATDRNEAKTWYSELPVKPDLKAVAAPGGAGLLACDDDIWSTVPSGTGSRFCGQADYDAYAGTSMATPHVAGVAGLLYAQGRGVDNVESTLLTTSRQPVTGARGVYTPAFGYGIVDAQAAVAAPGAATTTTKGNNGGGKSSTDKPRGNR
ncbi:MAG: S8 family serine peptidase [Actinomycetota bacterium]|nr:S8 family serine peptidase [Actinomycetota bacterium]